MRILIDIDSTFWNFGETLLAWNNRVRQTNYEFKEIKYWNWFYDHFFDSFSATKTECFWNMVQPYKNAVEVIEHFIKEGHEVFFVTASSLTENFNYKFNHLLSFFNPNLINEDNIIVARRKDLIEGDILIDDCMGNLLSFKQKKIRYIQPWNCPKKGIDYASNSWLGIKELIDNVIYKK